MGGGEVREPESSDEDVARYGRELEAVDWRTAEIGPELRDALRGAVHSGRPIELGADVREIWQAGHIYLGEPADPPWTVGLGERPEEWAPESEVLSTPVVIEAIKEGVREYEAWKQSLEQPSSKPAPRASKDLEQPEGEPSRRDRIKEVLRTSPHERERGQIVGRLSETGWPDPEDRARILQSLAGSVNPNGQVTVLAASFSVKQLEALQIAVKRAPKPEYRNRYLDMGGHARAECLERPGEWCRSIGDHPGVCDSCPGRNNDLWALARLLDAAVQLRRDWDSVMWNTPQDREAK